MKINIFKSAYDSKKPDNEIEFYDYLSSVKNGLWQDSVLAYRNGKLKKELLQAVTASGTFSERLQDKLIQHSGIICIDIDKKDQVCDFDIEAIKSDKYTHAVHASVSGYGYAVFIKIDTKKHKDAYSGLESYYLNRFKLIVDPAPKNVASLRFVSYDPDLFLNEKSTVFKEYVKVEKQNYQFYPTTQSDFEDIVRQVTDRGLNLCDSYDTWVQFAFALSSEFGANGRSYFHAFSCPSSKYDYQKTDKMYDIAANRKHSGRQVTIATIYHHCKANGVSIISEKTKQITTIAKLTASKKEAAEKLEELGIADDEGLVNKIKNKKEEELTKLDQVIELIKLSKVRFNVITRNYEFGKHPMSDRVLAQFYSKCWKLIDEDLSKDKIFTTIENPDNTVEYNPIRDFFAKNKHLKPHGNFKKLTECFTIDHKIDDQYVLDYLDIFLKKWLLSIVGSAHGTYSLMVLVLNGAQGISKTEFFRGLLPTELSDYYAESNLDEGKDSEILMTKKLVIVDDEFGGKSKKDYTKLKRLSSQQVFTIRRPYGRVSEDLQRLGVLGGTSNEREVVNDPTGNRRIIPINLLAFDIAKYRSIDKVDLFMELYHEWESDREAWFLTKEEIEYLNDSTIVNQEVMSEEELVNDFVEASDYNTMTNTQIKLHLESQFNSFRTTSKRIGIALKKCGHESVLQRINGTPQRVYKCRIKGSL